MAQAQDAVFYHGDQLNIDHVAGADIAAGEIVPLGANLVGIANIAIANGKQGALDVGGGLGVYKFKKDGTDTFALGAFVSWDDTANQVEPFGGANEDYVLGVAVAAAIATDDFVLVRFDPTAVPA